MAIGIGTRESFVDGLFGMTEWPRAGVDSGGMPPRRKLPPNDDRAIEELIASTKRQREEALRLANRMAELKKELEDSVKMVAAARDSRV